MTRPVTSAQIQSVVGGFKRAKHKSIGARKPVTPVTKLYQRGTIWVLV